MAGRLYKVLTSLTFTVVLLALGFVLVLWGTVAQRDIGLYQVQRAFFRSFVLFEQVPGTDLRLPFVGGYLVGGLLLINLFAAHFRYYRPGGRKLGVALIHLGVVLLLVGQLLTDLLSVESTMHLRNGETRNYSEASGRFELAVTDKSDANADQVVVIPATRLSSGTEVRHPALPFTVRVPVYYENSELTEQRASGFAPVATTAGAGTNFWWRPLRKDIPNRSDVPSASVELAAPSGSLGTFLVSPYLNAPQTFEFGGRPYELALRNARLYKPFQIHLLEFRHDKYPGTDIPRNFSSRVRVLRPATAEDREVVISMNKPLRYAGETYYQASFDKDDQGTVLQVVRNPGWLTPYFGCLLVGIGMLVQFGYHLLDFIRKLEAKA